MTRVSDQRPAPEGRPRGTIAPLWSAVLPSRAAGRLLVDRRGHCVVADGTGMVSVAPDGRRGWAVTGAGRAFDGPVPAPDGTLLRVEADQVVARDAATGRTVRSFTASLATGLAVTASGDPLFCEGAPGGAETLRCVTPAGEHRWSTPLGGPLAHPPAVLGDTVLIADRGALRALDDEGRVRWVADHTGARDAPAGAAAGDELASPPLRVDDHTLLLHLRWYDGSACYLVDAAGRLAPFPRPRGYDAHHDEQRAARPVRPPMAVVPEPAGGYQVVAAGPPVEVRQMEYEHPVVGLDATGAVRWEHRAPAAPSGIQAGPGGRVVVSATPSRRRWDDYHLWSDLSAHTFVRCLAADGTVVWTWHPPAPLSHLPAVSQDGTIYVGSAGRLWALPGPPAAAGVS